MIPPKRTPEEKAIRRKKRALEAKQAMAEKGRVMQSGTDNYMDGWAKCGGGRQRLREKRSAD